MSDQKIDFCIFLTGSVLFIVWWLGVAIWLTSSFWPAWGKSNFKEGVDKL